MFISIYHEFSSAFFFLYPDGFSFVWWFIRVLTTMFQLNVKCKIYLPVEYFIGLTVH